MPMNRIAIIGISGSGKSTFANKLGKKLNRPVIHLDKYFWTTGWKERYATRDEFRKVAAGFTNQEEWIIDGNYRSTMENRLDKADTIIFLDFPKWKCTLRVLKRTFNRKQPFDKPEGLKERVDWGFIKFILDYPTDETRELVKRYENTKKVYIVKNDKEIKLLLETLTG